LELTAGETPALELTAGETPALELTARRDAGIGAGGPRPPAEGD
jgi:hypothetical protein